MSRPWMPLYVADYLADTMHLSTAQHGAYLLLIMHYWRAGMLPRDDETLARITRMSAGEWNAARPTIAALFEDDWTHKRIDAELAKSSDLTTKRQQAASKRRANAPANDPHLQHQLHTQSQSQPHEEDRMVDARARSKSTFTEGSKALANAFWKALGFNHPIDIPPEFSGVDYRAIEWEKAGWTIDLVSSQAKRLALDQPLKPLTYFEKVFATSFAKQNAPLPVVEIKQADKLTVTTNGQQTGNIIQAADRLVDTLRSFDAGAGDVDDVRGGALPAPVRMLPKG